MTFRDWYVERHGAFPGSRGEMQDRIFERLCNSVAEYVDEATKTRELRLRSLEMAMAWMKSTDFSMEIATSVANEIFAYLNA